MYFEEKTRIEIEVVPGIVIDHAEFVRETLAQKLNIDEEIFDLDPMFEYIREENDTILYFNNKLEIKNRNCADWEAGVAWADTGYCDKEGRRLFISFIKSPYFGTYYGHVVGNAKYLCRLMAAKNSKYKNQIYKNWNSIKSLHENILNNRQRKVNDLEEFKKCVELASDKENHDKQVETDMYTEITEKEMTCITEEIFADLMYPSWKSIYGLDRYIKVCGTRIKQLVNDKKNNYFIANKVGGVVINSGLMDHFGNDYLIMYRRYHKEDEYDYYRVYRIMSSKSDFIEEGFTKEQSAEKIDPINFFNEGENVLSLTMDEIDMTPRNLTHIIEERRERFPEKTKYMSVSVMTQRVLNSFKMSISLFERDRTIAKPVYSSRVGHISWLLPLYIERNITEEPEMVVLLDKVSDFYQIKTVMVNDDEIKDRITALNLYGKVW